MKKGSTAETPNQKQTERSHKNKNAKLANLLRPTFTSKQKTTSVNLRTTSGVSNYKQQ